MFGIVANVESDRVFRTGAKVYILTPESFTFNCLCNGISKSGRLIEKHISLKRLTNFRAAFVPDCISKRYYKWNRPQLWESKEKCSEAAKRLEEIFKDIRYFSKDGKELLKDGKTSLAIRERAGKGYFYTCIPLHIFV